MWGTRVHILDILLKVLSDIQKLENTEQMMKFGLGVV